MTKVVSFSLGFFFLFAVGSPSRAQNVAPPVSVSVAASSDSAMSLAASKAIENQADTITLRQRILEARAAEARGDLQGAAKLYDNAYELTQKIGSGIDAETAQTVAGLVRVRMTLAKQAQDNGDYLTADTQVSRVLKVAPHDPAVIAFKQKNDQLVEASKGQRPDVDTLSKVPAIQQEKQDASTLVQDGKMLYEAGKFEESEVKLQQALKLDPDNQAAYYYLNLVKQAFYGRGENIRMTETQDKMLQVEKEWVPKLAINLPVPNPYSTNTDVHTSAERERIYEKLSRERLDNVPWQDGLPLSEVMTFLRDQSKARDPEQKGVNFLFNPNQETGGAAAEAGGAGAAQQIDPQTGLPRPAAAGGGGAGETIDPSTITVKLSLSDVTLQEALDAIVLVADRPIKYSVGDFGVIFSTKPSGPEPPELDTRTFHVDPNTFYQGLQSVTTFTFGSANSSSSGGSGGTSGGGGNSGGNSGGNNSGGSSGSSVSGAVVPVVNIAGGGGGGGGGGGRGGNTGGGGGGGGGTGGIGGGGSGVDYLTRPGNMSDVSTAARDFFTAIGINMAAPGRSIAFNDRLGLLFVKAAPSELDSIERAIHALNEVAPQVHIKARFIEVTQNDSTALGFDWYLGNFINGDVVANGGSAPSLTVPVSGANPLGAFPGNTPASLVPASANDQLLTGGLRNSGPALATITGILTDPNFRVVLHALQQRDGADTLAEPEVVTTSGRQTQMRATDIQNIVIGFDFQAGNVGTTTGGTTTTP